MCTSQRHIQSLYGNESPDSKLSRVCFESPLPPRTRVVDGFRPDAKLLAQTFHQYLYPLYLAICRVNRLAVGYDADADGLTAAVRRSAGRGRQLPLPSLGRLYLPVTPAGTVTYAEVAVDIRRVGQAIE